VFRSFSSGTLQVFRDASRFREIVVATLRNRNRYIISFRVQEKMFSIHWDTTGSPALPDLTGEKPKEGDRSNIGVPFLEVNSDSNVIPGLTDLKGILLFVQRSFKAGYGFDLCGV
jgi:hypothetical protein